MLLTADWHLTDLPQDEYRWGVFDALNKLPQQTLICAGDITDRKDRHSAKLVNRLIEALYSCTHFDIRILLGNHDKPLNGSPFWEFLNHVDGIQFYAKPHADEDRLFLPYCANPKEEWAGIPFQRYKVAFLHQTVTGAVGNNGVILENPNMPSLTRLKAYAGDIHTPQVVKNVTYIGAPHHINFGDDYPCRMLVINDDTYAIEEEIKLTPPRKHMIRISTIEDLDKINTHIGDQAKVIYKLKMTELDTWPQVQDHVMTWSKTKGIHVVSCEPDIVAVSAINEGEWERRASDLNLDPANVLRMFCEAERIDDSLLAAGLELLNKAHA